MTTPRTIRIVRLMISLGSAILHNERLQLAGNLPKLDELGGVYTKFLQIAVLSLNPKDQQDYQKMLSVYEKSHPDDIDIRAYLAKVNPGLLPQLASLSNEPMAAGSFGQVYGAQLTTGEQVIVKILRPKVMRYLRYDLRIIWALSIFYSLIDQQKMLDFQAIYRELRKTCLQETDYIREAYMAEEYYQTYRNHSQLVIPKTFIELSNAKVIVQERIEGLSVTDLLISQSKGTNAREFVREYLGSELYDQLYVIGFELLSRALVGDLLHADPHPGNIILLSGNRIALIDFGMLTQLTENRTAFYEMLLQYQAYYGGGLEIQEFALAAMKYLSPKLFLALGEADRLLMPKNTGPSSTNLIEKLRNTTLDVAQGAYTMPMIESMLERKQIMKVLFFAINKGNRFGMTFDLRAINLIKAARTYMTVLGQFDHESEIIARVMTDVVSFAQANLEQIVDGSEPTLAPHEALEILAAWFDKMARNDPGLMHQLVGSYLK